MLPTEICHSFLKDGGDKQCSRKRQRERPSLPRSGQLTDKGLHSSTTTKQQQLHRRPYRRRIRRQKPNLQKTVKSMLTIACTGLSVVTLQRTATTLGFGLHPSSFLSPPASNKGFHHCFHQRRMDSCWLTMNNSRQNDRRNTIFHTDTCPIGGSARFISSASRHGGSAALSATTTTKGTVDGTAVGENNNNSGGGDPLYVIGGGFVAVAIVIVLGFSSTLEEIPTNVIDASIPTTSTDLLAIALGESIGGFIGALFSVAINLLLRAGIDMSGMNNNSTIDDEEYKNGQSSERAANIKDLEQSVSTGSPSMLFQQALSDSDFFIANGAALSLLQLVGVSPRTAQLWSVLIAAVPSQVIKVTSQIKSQRRQEEDRIMDELLRIQQDKEKRKRNKLDFWKSWVNPSKGREIPNSDFNAQRSKTLMKSTVIEGKETGSQTDDVASMIDVVAVFADVTRWLEYDVLKSEFGEMLELNMIDSGMMGALLGLVAAVSSRLYADVLYGQFAYGPPDKQEEVRKRSISSWLSMYTSTAASAAALFGIYELSQKPISRYIQGMLAGGVDGCFGSNDFEACLETYLLDNAPGPTPEAQVRALVVNLNMVLVRLQDIAGDTTYEDVQTLVRAWAVSFMSYMNHFLAQ